MTDSRAARWAEQRETGKSRFILVQGVGWSVLMFVLMAIWESVERGLSWEWVGLNAAVWLAAGVLYGGLMWRVNDRLYESHRGHML